MNKQLKANKVLGIMSGTSLDGIDFCLVEFNLENGKWSYSINSAQTIPYSKFWKEKLLKAETCEGRELIELHHKFGQYIGEMAKTFLQKKDLTCDFISSHGHTIFHEPEKGYTFQLGHGASICAASNIKTICDFRTMDVAYMGQGAPLVPIGDQLLFSDYKACLNLGGFANISSYTNSEVISFDICAVNMGLNYLCEELELDYDKNGAIAKGGEFDQLLFEQLNALPFFQKKGPKSLGKEWFSSKIIPILNASTIPVQDKLNTYCHHISQQIVSSITNNGIKEPILCTGGGAKNTYLLEILRSKNIGFYKPEAKLIDFKEALIFAFLGVLRNLQKPNSLRAVTGSKKDNIGGCIYLP